ncbi:PucR family transcriptional regulator [Solwaraspora sp. WMMA2080]|uniref:PucR family transcriptional regulator n=1 Tax=unclassified Solwaraspora TaxID=2627926 RepID=UPI00248BF955|nr:MULTISPECIES: PucR family transcriptional regulator [unclassified Solwaraspora]WBB99769.1 PucR family transcriptional regulator [Solwaraspora sp. WMMA2059]WBC21681.1 PucR family transcriptional regulator [Solwaraspora sp. WMMA2080]
MLLADVLDKAHLKLVPLTGDDGRDRTVGRVNVIDLPDPGRYVATADLVLTGLMWHQGPDDSEVFVVALAAAGVTALGAGEALHGSVPRDLVAACRRHRLPLFEVPADVSFRDIIDDVHPTLWAQRASSLAAVLGRQRGLVAAMAAGARLTDLLPTVAAAVETDCWTLTTSGRVVAGTAELADPVAEALSRAFLTAQRLPATVTVDGARFSVFGVPGRAEHRLAAWLVACRGALDTLPGTVDELTSVVALERAHLDEAARVEARLAGQLRTALRAPGDLAGLRAALLAARLDPDATFVAVAATLDEMRAPATLTVAVVDEFLSRLAPDRAVTVLEPDLPCGALAVLALAPQAAGTIGSALVAAADRMVPGLRGGRLVLGVSAASVGAAGLGGAVEEALHAHRSATSTATGPVSVVAAGELASHSLLLAGVPAGTRQGFRSRLLGPVEEYDRAHHADLLRTLSVFLDCDGSWSRCAQRLHVHVNTLRYRIGRIEQLTGRDLGRFEDRVDFFLALRLTAD